MNGRQGMNVVLRRVKSSVYFFFGIFFSPLLVQCFPIEGVETPVFFFFFFSKNSLSVFFF